MMKLTVFFSWEMETDNQGFSNKKFLICCIRKALNAIQGKGDLRNVTFEPIWEKGERRRNDFWGKETYNVTERDENGRPMELIGTLKGVLVIDKHCYHLSADSKFTRGPIDDIDFSSLTEDVAPNGGIEEPVLHAAADVLG